uniref:Prolamin-like domain-containing protein n=1 Tax=Brassica oleracea var. oleracea TaxID=109376 RepID=A0A0D3DJV3_BRAOL
MVGPLDDRRVSCLGRPFDNLRVACLGRPLDDRRVVRCSDHSTIVEWPAWADHSTIVEWFDARTVRRVSSGLLGPTSGSMLGPFDVCCVGRCLCQCSQFPIPFPFPLLFQPSPGIPRLPDVAKCWSSVMDIPGCIIEIYTSILTGQFGHIGPSCCKAFLEAEANCLPKLPFNPLFSSQRAMFKNC